MLTEPQKLWVEALRSGEFRQCRRKLSNGIGYCCLGVACRLFADSGGSLMDCWQDHGTLCGDREVVRDWLGLSDDEGSYQSDDLGVDSLAGKNDEGLSFAEIADIIESEPAGLFVTPAPEQAPSPREE